MARVKRLSRAGVLIGYSVKCPGCGWRHLFYTEEATERGARWTFDGNMERPTFSPSMLVTWEEGEERTPMRCHSFVRDGRIQYLSDCTHEMAGQTIDLPEFE